MKVSYILKKGIVLAVVAMLYLGLAACQRDTSGTSYEIYYKNSEGNQLVHRTYRSSETDREALANELIAQMDTRQRDKDYVVLKPDYLTIDHLQIVDNTATLTFSSAYYEMEVAEEVLYRAGLVQQICQVENVAQVRFMVGENEATYQDGTAIGVMTRDSFANDSAVDIENVQWRTLNLYYANRTGDHLLKDEVSVAYSKNIPLEKVIVEKLIRGPETSGFYATLPSDMRLLSISVSNGICYVNISSEFSTEMVNVGAMLPVYSIVNSLCELDNINQVKLMINGDSTKNFRESINLDMLFEYNGDLVSQ